MAEIRNFGIVRHLRAEPTSHIIKYKKGRVHRSERGVALWFLPMSSSLAEVPVDDRELSFLFHGRSSDFQDVTTQGIITYRVAQPETTAERIDFSIDLRTGVHLKQPLEKLALFLNELAQQFAWAYGGSDAGAGSPHQRPRTCSPGHHLVASNRKADLLDSESISCRSGCPR